MSRRGGGRNVSSDRRGPPPAKKRAEGGSSTPIDQRFQQISLADAPAKPSASSSKPLPSSSSHPLPSSSSQPLPSSSSQPLPSSSQQPPAQIPAKPTPSSSVSQPQSLAPIAPTSSKSVRPPARPGYGKAGKKCTVRANHFLIKLPERKIHHYNVSVKPEVSKGLNRVIMRQLIHIHKDSMLGGRLPVYDGSKSIYTAAPLPFTTKEFAITLDATNGDARRERLYRVTIELVATPDLHHLMMFLAGRHSDVPQETLQALDVVMRESPSLRYTTVGRSYFSPEFGRPEGIGNGLECWKGFYQSIRPTQMGLSLNIDISSTAFYESVSVIDFVAQLLNVRDRPRPMSDSDRVKVKKALKGLKVVTVHQDNKRKYKISGITPLPTNQLKFSVDDTGNEITVVQYFKDRYNFKLQHVIWPALLAGSDTKPTYLPMEVCKIAEGQRYGKKLNERQVTAILKSTCLRPPMREQKILKMVSQNNYNGDKFANEFGIKVIENLTSIEARVLPPPELMYFGKGREASCRPALGAWNMINRKMINGARIDYWTCVNFSRCDHGYVSQFAHDLVAMCSNIGMNFVKQPLIPITSVRPNRVDLALQEVDRLSVAELERLGVTGRKLQLLIVVLPDLSGSYGSIKRVCETELGIVSQCCQPKSIGKGKQYLENVALKINVKAGGTNTVLADAVNRRIPLLSDVPTIIFGADVTHPPPGEDSSPSIAAVVASMDWPHVTKYRCLLSTQTHRQELIQDLYKVVEDPKKGVVHSGLIRDHLLAFRRATRQKPSRIIFYRDGVSEGQFSQVLLHEMDAIRKACQSLEGDYLPPVTFVVVQKRHHTRLFPAEHGNRELTDRSGNILPGTVVDTAICHPTEFDFYLCSHAGIQGTSRPTHYHVLFDENKFTADGLQSLTNNLCYTFARCTRSVSVVPPAYYAHLAAFRARYYIEGDVSDGESSGRNAVVRVLPAVKDNVKEVMFFC